MTTNRIHNIAIKLGFLGQSFENSTDLAGTKLWADFAVNPNPPQQIAGFDFG